MIISYFIDGQVWCTITCNINESNEVKIKEQINFISNGDGEKDDASNNGRCEPTPASDAEDEDESRCSLPEEEEDDEELEVDDDCKNELILE